MDSLGISSHFKLLLRQCAKAVCLPAAIVRPKDLPDLLREAQIEIRRIAADHQAAEHRGQTMAAAAHDHENYPNFAKFHTGLEDALRWSMPANLAKWIRPLLRSSTSTERFIEPLLQWMLTAARTSDNPDVRTACRIALFELIRVALILQATFEGPAVPVVVDDLQISRFAEEAMEHVLDSDHALSADTMNRALALATAFHDMHVLEACRSLEIVAPEISEAAALDAARTAKLHNLDLRDALLLRNHTASEWREQKLSLNLLRQRHPIAFEGMTDNDMSKRWSRFQQQALTEGLSAVQRKRPALIDLAKEAFTNS